MKLKTVLEVADVLILKKNESSSYMRFLCFNLSANTLDLIGPNRVCMIVQEESIFALVFIRNIHIRL